MGDNLSLKIVLEAADKITAPVRRILGVTSSLEDQLAATRRELRDLNAAQKDIASYDKLTQQITDVGASMNLAQQRVSKYENNLSEAKTSSREFRTELSRAEIELSDLRKQMSQTENPSKQLVEQFTRAEKIVSTLNKRIATADGNVDKYTASLTKAQISLQRTETRQKTYNDKLKETAGRLKTAGVSTDKLKEEQKRLRGVVDGTTKSLNEQSKAAGKLAEQQRRVKNVTAQRDKVMQRAQAMTVTGAGGMHTGKTIVRETLENTAGAAIDDEAAFGGVKKVVDFASPEAAQKFRKELQLMSMDMPTVATGLYDIAEAGGQLGVKQEDLKEFTNTTAVMSIAFDMVASKTGKSMATLSNVYDMPINQMRSVGDAINHLSNNTAAKAGDIVETVARIGGVSKEFGLTVVESSALADAMIALGKAPDVAATGINALLLKMQTARIQGKPFQKGLAQIGITAEELEGKVRNNAQGALVEFLETLETLPDADRMNVIGQMFGAEYADDISALVGSMGNYKKALNLVAKEANYAGSMQAEFDSKNSSTKAGLQRLENQLQAVKVSLGSGMLPMINDILKQARPMIQTVMDWTQANPELTKTLMMTVLAVGALAAAGGALTMMIAGLLGPFAMVRYGMAMIGLKGLGVISMFRSLGGVFMWLGRLFLLNPIGLAITAIAGGAYLIYKNWDFLKNWWNTTSWKQKIFDVASFLSPINLMKKGAQEAWVWWKGTEWGQKSLEIITPVLDAARATGEQALMWWLGTSWGQKSLNVGTSVLEAAKQLAADFVKMWNSFTLKSLIPDIKWPSVPSWVPGFGKSESNTQKQITTVVKESTETTKKGGFFSNLFGGQRATGGPVSAGQIYQVNELGPELLTMGGKTYLMAHQSGNVTAISHQANTASNSTASTSTSKAIENTVDSLNQITNSVASNSINQMIGHSAGNTLSHLINNASASNDSRLVSTSNSYGSPNTSTTDQISTLSNHAVNSQSNSLTGGQANSLQRQNSLSNASSNTAINNVSSNALSSTATQLMSVAIKGAATQVFGDNVSSAIGNVLGSTLNNANSTIGGTASTSTASTSTSKAIENTVDSLNQIANSVASNSINQMIGHSAGNTLSHLINNASASNDSRLVSAANSYGSPNTSTTDQISTLSNHAVNSQSNSLTGGQANSLQRQNSLSNATSNTALNNVSSNALSSTATQLMSVAIKGAATQMFGDKVSTAIGNVLGSTLNNANSTIGGTASNDARYVTANTNLSKMLGTHAENNSSQIIQYAANSNVASNDASENSVLSNRFGDNTNVADLLAMQSTNYQNSSNANSSNSHHVEAPMTVKITVNAAQGMDENAVAAAIQRKLLQVERDRERRQRGRLHD